MADENTSTTEIWKPIPDWGMYEVSNQGRVRRPVQSCGTRTAGHVLSPGYCGKGYLFVNLRDRGRHRHGRIHALVCEVFIGPRPPGMTINHKDGVKTNNRIENLEYMTNANNMRHAAENGLRPRGDESGRRLHLEKYPIGEQRWWAKLTDEKVREIRRLCAEGLTNRAIAPMFGVSENRISQIKQRKSWTHVI